MDIALFLLVGIFAFCVIMIIVGADALERQFQRMHPPDDGMSEVKPDEHD